MKAVGLFTILLAIPISNNEINGAKLEKLEFFDNDFTDYEELTAVDAKGETKFTDKVSISREDLEPTFKTNENYNPEEIKTSLKTPIKASFTDEPKATLIESNRIETLNPEKAKSFLRAKRDTSFSSLGSIETENTETIFRRIEKLNPQKAKELLRAKREVSFSNLASLKEGDNESKLTRIEELTSKEAKELLTAIREISVLNEAPTSPKKDIKPIFTIIKEFSPQKAIQLLRAMTQVNIPDETPISLKVGDIESKFTNKKLTPREVRELLNLNRDMIFSEKTPNSQTEKKLNLRRKSHLNPANAKVIQKDKVPTTIEEADNEIQSRSKAAKMTPKEEKAAKKHAAQLELRNDNKVNEILDFIKKNKMTTNYIYEEIQRIKKQGQIRDKLRRLVQYLEQDNHDKLKDSVLKCYYAKRIIDKPIVDFWKNHEVNNVIINTFKDPYNDGI